ncbi:PREDICTED: non-syndromic hearing impairment protein 5 isoform X2 [Corvus brachyrhynchos]|uniref:non-syndromic hearing impairment protein 5 isoform X2 n=1 Tax=Corvus brachyrhynchos TaxID=85066 RepID=UPI0008163522|nr:PREDICTED: non-syndromic hearing impairment protein 5 isoform X2 [Corvus brachyrhynchos]
MFAKATKNFVRETDSGGDLIPVSHLNASDKLQLLSLVTKRRKFWCWQKPKYHFLTVTLSDVLTEDKPIKPVIVESDFAKYMGKFEDFLQGSIETSFVKISLGAGGKGYVENQSSFGNLRKQEIDLQQLMKDVKDRTIDLSSSLLQQVIERKREVLCILREKIITTQKCTISEHIQTEEKVRGAMGCTAKTIKVSVSENGSLMKDSSVILEIPPATAIAYGVIELFIRHNGQFDLSRLKTQFQPFVKLPEDKQRALYKTLCELLLHEEMVTALGDMFDDICTGDKPDLEELKLEQQGDLLRFLQLLGCSLQSELLLQKYQPQDEELFSAAHLLISAMSELPDDTLVLLRACCDLQVVPALCCLPNIASADGTVALSSPLVATLADRGRFEVVQRLFASSNINLEMTESSVKAVTMKEPRFFPLVLYVALFGFHALGGNV